MIFKRFEEFNVRVNGQKCLFFRKEVDYLGHTLSGEGIRPKLSKVEDIIDAPRPKDASELRPFLGMMNFYVRFRPIPNLATELHSLYSLLQSHKL